jgi:hypothetical protein
MMLASDDAGQDGDFASCQLTWIAQRIDFALSRGGMGYLSDGFLAKDKAIAEESSAL